MAPTAVEPDLTQLTGDERAAALKAGSKDRPLDTFVVGGHPLSGHQTKPLHHAAALRWLGLNGYNNEGAGGYVTVRDPILPDHFWINSHAVSFSYIKPEDLCLVNESGEVVEPGNMHTVNPAGFAMHVAVHQARPDAIAAVHCHSLEPINQDACRFYEDHAIYEGFGGLVLAHEEGRQIAASLGNNKAVILANHGILTVTKTVDGATFIFGPMDRCIQAQLQADAAAAGRGISTIKVGHEEAQYTRRIYTDEMEWLMFQSCFEDIVRASHGELPATTGKEIPRD